MLPTAYDSIHFGLLQAARRNPLRVPAGDVPNLVRRALFDTDPADDEHDPEFLEIVAGRALEAIGKHLDPDENSKRFKAWLFGPGNSFISQIAKQRKAPGGTLDRERVRRALLQLGWNAYRKAADFLHAQMRDFENALPEPLSETERTLFEHAHLRQPYLGELPLVLISERMSFVRRAVLAIWESPEEQRHQSVLHRLLEYYALMVRSRQEADLRFKSRLRRNPHTGQRAKIFVFDGARDGQIESRQSVAADVAESLRELRRITCKCRDPRWHFNVLDANRESIRVEYLCEGCGLRFETTAIPNELLGLIDDA